MSKSLLIAGLSITALISFTSCNKESKKDIAQPIPSAMTLAVTPGMHAIRFESAGELKSRDQAMITPRVTGPIVWTQPKLGPGLKVKKGEVLYKIDQTDYELRLRQKKAALSQAQLEFEKEKTRSEITQKQLAAEENLSTSPLARRDLQLAFAEANLSSAQASYDEAKVQLDRTNIRAPFDGVLLNSNASLGQMASNTQPTILISGTNDLISEISLSSKVAAYLPELPQDVELTQHLSDGTILKGTGQLIQLSNQLDPQSRKFVGTVLYSPKSKDHPFGGSFIDIAFKGAEQDNRAMIPASALLPQRAVWYIENETLLQTPVDVLWESTDSVLISLTKPLDIVLLPPEGPIPGMPVKGIAFKGVEE